jgi:hypothetical protein
MRWSPRYNVVDKLEMTWSCWCALSTSRVDGPCRSPQYPCLNLERGLIVYKIPLLNVMIHHSWHPFIGCAAEGNPSSLAVTQ